MKQAPPSAFPRRRPGVLVLAALLFGHLAGCVASTPPLVSETGTPLPLDDVRARRVFDAHLESQASRRAIQATARVAIDGPDWKLDRPQRIAAERPSRLRLEIVGLFDQLAAILATDGAQYGFFDASTGRIHRGRLSDTLLWDLARIDLEPPEAVELLLGGGAPSPGLGHAAVWLEPDGRVALAFAAGDAGRTERCQALDSGIVFATGCAFEDPTRGLAALARGGEVFYFDEVGHLVEIRALEAASAIRFRARFARHEVIAGEGPDAVVFPKEITLETPAVATVARFRFKRVMLPLSLSDRLFSLPEREAKERGR